MRRNISSTKEKSMLLMVFVVAVLLVGGCVVGESTPPPGWSPEGTVTKLTPQEAFGLIQENSDNPDFVLIDVRTESDFAAGHIEGAVNIPRGTLLHTMKSLDKSKTYLTYCPDGCGAAARRLLGANFQKIYDIEGGYSRWVSEGFPIVQ